MNSDSSSAHEGVHLLVLMHGLWGNVHNVKYMAEQFKKELGDRIVVYRAHSNQNSHTYDGVDVCGQRLAQEILEIVDKIENGCDIEELKGHKRSTKSKSSKKPFWKPSSSSSSSKGFHSPSSTTTAPTAERPIEVKSSNPSDSTTRSSSSSDNRRKITQFSILGYSLGGLFARFAIGMLEAEGFFNQVKPIYFVTMASPHLGIHHPIDSPWSSSFNYLTKNSLYRSGKQLHFKDRYIDSKPILLVMSEPTSTFMKGLARFKTRAIYSNIRNDNSVPFWSASISDANPFTNLHDMEIQFSPEYSSVIESFELESDETISKRKRERKEKLKSQSLVERTSARIKQVNWEKAFVYGVVTPILAPVAVLFGALAISAQYSSSKMRVNFEVKPDPEMKKAWDKDLLIPADTANSENDQQGKQSLRDQQNQQDLGLDQDQNQDDVLERDTLLYQQDSNKKTVEIKSMQVGSTDSGIPTVAEARDSGDLWTTKTTTQVVVTSVIQPSMDLTADNHAVSIKDPKSGNLSLSYPNLQQVHPLHLLPVIIQVAKNLNKLEWKKYTLFIHALNAHAAIIIREKRFSTDGGIAAVKHVIDMFKEEGEDE